LNRLNNEINHQPTLFFCLKKQEALRPNNKKIKRIKTSTTKFMLLGNRRKPTPEQ
jgi:hypothetical protein